MKKISLRKTFITLAALGVILNVFSDIWAFRQASVKDMSVDKVLRSYERLELINNISLAFLTVRLSQDFNRKDPSWTALDRGVSTLLTLSNESTGQVQSLQKMNLLLKQAAGPQIINDFPPLIESLRLEEKNHLAERLVHDRNEELSLRDELMWAIALDLAIVILISIIFGWEWNLRKSTEETLRKTLETLREDHDSANSIYPTSF